MIFRAGVQENVDLDQEMPLVSREGQGHRGPVALHQANVVAY